MIGVVLAAGLAIIATLNLQDEDYVTSFLLLLAAAILLWDMLR